MLYTGPWHRSITAFDSASRAAFVRHAARGLDLPVHWLNVDGTCSCNELLGVAAGGEIRASLGFRVRPHLVKADGDLSAVADAAIWVEPDWRQRGMGLALLQQAVTRARCADIGNLVFDGLGTDIALRRLVLRFAADLIFADHDCQAWIDLAPTARYCPANV